MQVEYIQDRINGRIEREFPSFQLQMKVRRINMKIVSGNYVTWEPTRLNLERILGQEIIQKTTPPEPDNKAEDKINIDADIDFEPLNVSAQQFSPEIFYTPQKSFDLTSLQKAYIETMKAHEGSIGVASLPT